MIGFKRAAIVVMLVVGAAGCVSLSTPMKHTDGRITDCSATGFGWLGVPTALIMRENCVSNARTNGFTPLDESGSATAKETVEYTGEATVSLPEGWIRTPPPAVYALAIDYAKNATYGAYMLLSYAEKNNITDIAAFAETKKAEQLSKLRDTTSTVTTKTTIKGRTVYVTDVEGMLPANGTKYHFRQTVVDDGGEILLLTIWTAAANYDGKVKNQIDAFANGLNWS